MLRKNRPKNRGSPSRASKATSSQKSSTESQGISHLSFLSPCVGDGLSNTGSDHQVITFDDADGKHDSMTDFSQKKKPSKSGGFQSMDLVPEVFQGIMKMGFKVPTPIQRKAIPQLLEGHDVVAMARTGSGKTAAFAIPLLHKLAQNRQPGGVMRAAGVRAIVLSPTRELVQQTFKVISQLGRFMDFRIIMLIGGQSMNTQFELLSNTPDILVATPGRLVHHLLEVKFSLLQVEFCCFDEADRLFEMGFAQQLYEIIKRMGETRQTCLFSATMPNALIEFSRAGLKNPVTIRLDSESKLSPDLAISFFLIRTRDKVAALLYTLNKVIPAREQCLVFVSTRHHVDFLVSLLRADGVPVAGVYGQMDTEARADSIHQFRRKEIRVMVVTDVAARGIDIPLLDNVINYDFPCQPKLFIHRAGRVARNGRKGSCHSFICPDELPFLIDLYLFFAWKMPLLEGAAQTDRVHAAGDIGAGSTPGATHSIALGKFPTSLLDRETEHAHLLISTHDLQRMHDGSERAYRKYVGMRPMASKASTKRWKELRPADIHPFFTEMANSSNASDAEAWKSMSSILDSEKMIEEISNFTPDQTIFELYNRDLDVIRQKRHEHDMVIKTRLKEVKQRELEMSGGPLAPDHDDELINDAPSPDASDQAPLSLPKTVRIKRKIVPAKQNIMTAADRRKAKRQREQVKQGKIAPDSDNQLTIENSESSRKKRRGALGTDELRDKHYITLVPSGKNVFEELGLSINNLNDLSFQLNADDDETALKAKKVEKWSDRKKKFITVYESKDAFGKLITNESGKKVSRDYVPGQLYDKWRRQSRYTDTDAGHNDDNDDDGKDGQAGLHPKQKAAQERRRLRGLQSIAESHRERQKNDVGRGTITKTKGEFGTGIRSKYDILKERQENQKNRERHNRSKSKAKGKGKGGGKRR